LVNSNDNGGENAISVGDKQSMNNLDYGDEEEQQTTITGVTMFNSV
jgi:hypothetical protein